MQLVRILTCLVILLPAKEVPCSKSTVVETQSTSLPNSFQDADSLTETVRSWSAAGEIFLSSASPV